MAILQHKVLYSVPSHEKNQSLQGLSCRRVFSSFQTETGNFISDIRIDLSCTIYKTIEHRNIRRIE